VSTRCGKTNKGCVYIDAENSFDKEYAERLGINLEKEHFILIQPNSAEEALGIIEISAQDQNVGLIVLDSVAAMVPTKEAFGAGEVGDSHVGLMARLMTQWVRRITPIMKNKSKCTIILVNQIREQISSSPFVSTHTPGGHALKHAASIRIKLARKSTVKDGSRIGINVIAKVVKNKVAPPYEEAEFHIIGGEGIDATKELVDLLLGNKKIAKAGSWYKDLDGTAIGQGTSSVATWINAHKNIVTELLKDEGLSDIYAGNIGNSQGS